MKQDTPSVKARALSLFVWWASLLIWGFIFLSALMVFDFFFLHVDKPVGTDNLPYGLLSVPSLVYSDWSVKRNQKKTSRLGHLAIDELKKLQTVTRLGITYPEYSRRVLDCAVVVDPILSQMDNLPDIPHINTALVHNSLVSKLRGVMKEHSDAMTLWSELLKANKMDDAKETLPQIWTRAGEILDNAEWDLRTSEGGGE